MDRAVADFTYANFTGATGLKLVGNAAIVGDRLRLTPSSSNQRGAAWYVTSKQYVQDGFAATFVFRPQGIDGFAFVIQNWGPDVLGNLGLQLGYGGLANSLAVEFDAYKNGDLQDPDANHISVQTRGTVANNAHHQYSLGCVTPVNNMSDGNPHRVRISYVPGTLRVWLDFGQAPLLEVPLRLEQTLMLSNGYAWVGFTAGTGNSAAEHSILTWTFWEGWAPGDLNCDGLVDFGDINPFVFAMSNPAQYQQLYPDCDIMNGDINNDGIVGFGDINPFVRLLTQP
jgi:hypothetical protein